MLEVIGGSSEAAPALLRRLPAHAVRRRHRRQAGRRRRRRRPDRCDAHRARGHQRGLRRHAHPELRPRVARRNVLRRRAHRPGRGALSGRAGAPRARRVQRAEPREVRARTCPRAASSSTTARSSRRCRRSAGRQGGGRPVHPDRRRPRQARREEHRGARGASGGDAALPEGDVPGGGPPGALRASARSSRSTRRRSLGACSRPRKRGRGTHERSEPGRLESRGAEAAADAAGHPTEPLARSHDHPSRASYATSSTAPGCAEMQADGAPCPTTDVSCDECRKLTTHPRGAAQPAAGELTRAVVPGAPASAPRPEAEHGHRDSERGTTPGAPRGARALGRPDAGPAGASRLGGEGRRSRRRPSRRPTTRRSAPRSRTAATRCSPARRSWPRCSRPTRRSSSELGEDQVVFGFWGLPAARPEEFRALAERQVTAVGIEAIEDDAGRAPVRTSMSEIAGSLAVVLGSGLLLNDFGGKGILLGGVPGAPPANFVVLGAGVLGRAAARAALGLGAHVTLLDVSVGHLREAAERLPPGVTTMLATQPNIEKALGFADLVLGAVAVHAQRAPVLVTRAMLRLMKPRTVVVDLSIDMGGCFETSRPTTSAARPTRWTASSTCAFRTCPPAPRARRPWRSPAPRCRTCRRSRTAASTRHSGSTRSWCGAPTSTAAAARASRWRGSSRSTGCPPVVEAGR